MPLTSFVVFVALALGFAVGAGFFWLLEIGSRRRERAAMLLEPKLPVGVDTVIDALDSTAIIADPSHNVHRSSPDATAKGLVTRASILDARIGRVADEAWRLGGAVERDIVLPRGPFGRAQLTFRVRATPIALRFILILARDRTEAIRVEAVRRDFVGNVSHELKTPIGAVTLLAEAIGEASSDAEQVKEFAQRLLVEGDRLARLTRELIELSRLQSTDPMEQAEPCDLQEILTLACDQSRVAADANRITIHLGRDQGVRVLGDRNLLLMCFHNLVANAVQYSPEGSSVGVGAKLDDDAVEVSVADRGIGIPEGEQERIFERFYRVDAARSRHTGGSGLGLSIVRHVVENHGGDVRVWSKPGSGSTFTVRLPVLRPDRDPARTRLETGSMRANAEGSDARDGRPRGAVHVGIAEDSPSVSRTYAQ